MYKYRAQVLRVIDGDTIEACVDLGFKIYHVIRLRLKDVYAPEVRGEEKAAGEKAKKFLQETIEGEEVTIQTNFDKTFDRFVGVISAEGENINQLLVSLGYATRTKEGA